ncbi:MAG: hypothetical protein ACM3WV_11445 [Bacillota bacterium]
MSNNGNVIRTMEGSGNMKLNPIIKRALKEDLLQMAIEYERVLRSGIRFQVIK